MLFNHKHYRIIAEAIKDSYKGDYLLDAYHLISLLAYHFSIDNARFNVAKFKEACKKNE